MARKFGIPSRKKLLYIAAATVLLIATVAFIAQRPPSQKGQPNQTNPQPGQASPPPGGPRGITGNPGNPKALKGIRGNTNGLPGRGGRRAPLHGEVKTLKQQEEEDKKHSAGATVLGIFILIVPCSLSAWGFWKLWKLIEVERTENIRESDLVELSSAIAFGGAVPDHSDDEKEAVGRQRVLRNRSEEKGLNAREVKELETKNVQGEELSIGFVSYSIQKRKPCWRGFGVESKSRILNTVSATFKPGINAIMGPSGSGKTTLLNLIASRTKTGTMEGLFFIGSNRYTLDGYNQMMKQQGYVEQTDEFMEKLTVRESLMFSALLAMPDSVSLAGKLSRVTQVLSEVQLDSCASQQIGGSSFKGISGGQRRRLSIAKQLLHIPLFLILDEPTSGLDSTASYNMISMLRKLSTKHRTTIILTIHQPRKEIFRLFDTLLLLTRKGHQAYFGSAGRSQAFFQRNPLLSVDSSQYDNPGDFLIDAMDHGRSEELEKYWNDSVICHELMGTIRARCNIDGPPVTLEDIKAQGGGQDTEDLAYGGSKRAGSIAQIWVLFSRRMLKAGSSSAARWGKLGIYFQIVCVSFVIGDAFSYESGNDPFTPPYQSTMLLFIMSSYAMIVQYLVLVPEYFSERKIIKREREAGTIRYESYIASGLLADTPEAILQGLVVLTIAYIMGDLNDEPAYVHFAFIILMVGISAWQSAIQLVSMTSRSMGMVYTLCFIILGLGTLYGGVMVNYRNIPSYFVWAYYTSVPALTYRALIFNDLYCCKYTTTCEDFQNWNNWMYTPVDDSGSATNATCPAQIMEDSGASGNSNVGPALLAYMNIAFPTKYRAVIGMALMVMLFRICAVLVLWFREWYSENLQEENTTALVRKMHGVMALIRDVEAADTLNFSRQAHVHVDANFEIEAEEDTDEFKAGRTMTL